MKIKKLVIEKCIALLAEEQKAMRKDREAESKRFYGSPPKTMLIIYGKGNLKNLCFELTDKEQEWYYSEGQLEEVDLSREWHHCVSGRYFEEALAEFMLETESQRVYLNYYFGPLHARGMSFSVEQQEDTVRLGDERLHWVS